MQVRDVGLYAAVIILAIIFVYPLYILFLITFVPVSYTFGQVYPAQFPVALTFQNIITSLHTVSLVNPLIRSFEVALMVAALSLAMGIPAGYGLSKIKAGVANIIVILLFFVNMMPGIVVAIPIAAEFIKVGLYDNLLGIALSQELVVLPLSVFIMVGGFRSIPKDLDNQARVDGAGLFTSFGRISIPLVVPAIIVTFLLSWMTSWDEFTYAVIISPGNPTFPVQLYNYVTRALPYEASAFALLVTIPVIILAAILQKYLKGEYLTGGLVG
ncbi:MAG: carbohydrate ABC transporter permease [Candidatus Thermoplasmatota archaeon]|nr:carbohydrate ABC transporter permease [Candidatus Thermoplasmatota archaeon]